MQKYMIPSVGLSDSFSFYLARVDVAAVYLDATVTACVLFETTPIESRLLSGLSAC